MRFSHLTHAAVATGVAGGALAALACGGLASLPQAAAAAPPGYFLTVSEGSTTSAEYPVAETSGYSEANPSVRVSITRAGALVGQASGAARAAEMAQVPQPGDVISLESPAGTLVASTVYDGLPSLDASACAGSTSFSGQRTANAAVTVGYYTVKRIPYHGLETVGAVNRGEIHPPMVSGAQFAGSFPAALSSEQTVYALEQLTSTLPGGAPFVYYSVTTRPVGACPLMAALSPPGPPALTGRVAKFSIPRIRKLLRSGLLLHVFINQPGTAIADLYLSGGKVPAFAARRQRPALLVARGAATATRAGTVKLVVRATARGRRALRNAKRARVVLVTTLRSKSGVRVNVARRSLSLKR